MKILTKVLMAIVVVVLISASAESLFCATRVELQYCSANSYDDVGYYPLREDARSLKKLPVSVGENVVVDFPESGISVSFGKVTEGGVAFVAAMEDPPKPPEGFALIGTAYDINTTAQYGEEAGATVSVSWCAHCMPGSVSWCAHCSPQDLELYLKIMHYGESMWENVTNIANTETKTISGNVSNLSPFGVMLLTDQAAVIKNLIATISSMNLRKELESSLKMKLNSVLAVLTDKETDNNKSAISTLSYFISQCKVQREKQLTIEKADLLISRASMIIETIQY